MWLHPIAKPCQCLCHGASIPLRRPAHLAPTGGRRVPAVLCRQPGERGAAGSLARKAPFCLLAGPTVPPGTGACPGCRRLAGLASADGRAAGASRQKESAVTFP